MSRYIKPAVLAFVALALVSPLLAQDWVGRGRLQGIVKDEQGKPLAGAKVTLRPGSTGVDAANPGPPVITTDKSGRWSVLGLGGGPWGVLIELEGYIASEGKLNVTEEGPPAPAVIVTLKALSKEQKEPAKPSKTQVANAAIAKGNELLGQQKYAEARAEYQKAMELLEPPNQVPILRGIASTYYKESTEAKTKEEKVKEQDQAIAALKQALDLKPDDPDTLQLLVNLLVTSGHEADAKIYMAKLPADKLDPDMLLNLGIKAYNAKQLDKALDQFNQVITAKPELPEPYYYRGLVYLQMGKTAEAKADFKKLIELDPNNKYAKEAQGYLKDL
jgi:tetratricopeptide (TPR) repeat protein